MKNNDETAGAVLGLTYLVVLAILAVGWIMNVMTIWRLDWMTYPATKLILRCVGIFVFPIGGILGYL